MKDLLTELKKGIIRWYPFTKGKRALCIVRNSNVDNAIRDALIEMELSVDVLSITDLENIEPIEVRYDYIVGIHVLEYTRFPLEVLKALQILLTDDGVLLLGMDNRLGIRYFCGDRDPYTQRSFDGVENYSKLGILSNAEFRPHAYAKSELKELFTEAGMKNEKFYSVFPDLEDTQILISENYLPNESLRDRIMPRYHNPETVFLDEETMYQTLIENGMFHTMANAFFVEVHKDGSAESNINQVTISVERGREQALYTILQNDGKVRKCPVYTEGSEVINNLYRNQIYLKEHGVPMVQGTLSGKVLEMPYVEGKLRRGISNVYYIQIKNFLEELDRFWEIICNSSEHMEPDEVDWYRFVPEWKNQKNDNPNVKKWESVAKGSEEERRNLGVILRRGYIDLVSLNCFYDRGDFVFFDQELYVEQLPAKAILLRTINFVCPDDEAHMQTVSRQELMDRYGITPYRQLFGAYAKEFLSNLRSEQELQSYHLACRKNRKAIYSNRQRLNYSTTEYFQLFVNVFSGLEDKKVFLFGSGSFAKRFLAIYGEQYEVAGILDNNAEKQGTYMNGVRISSIESLRELLPNQYKVIICIKNYLAVLQQLREYGVINIGIYDTDLEYPVCKSLRLPINKEESCQPKKYHVGYIAGVFDLFHVGHLNLFKRAKKQCDYLLVGVVSDVAVREGKKTSPVVSEAERLEIVQACRYVDEAFVLPPDYGDTQDMHRKYHFDVQFSGSDYAHNPVWLEKQRYLRAHGAELIFFPYTESTSTTKRKAEIEQRLEENE